MAGSRGSALSRAIKFFEEADLREARAAFTIVEEVMDARMKKHEAGVTSQNKAAATPRKKRRTKAEIAADKAAHAAAPAGNEHKQESLASA